jgi:hypothetical protein
MQRFDCRIRREFPSFASSSKARPWRRVLSRGDVIIGGPTQKLEADIRGA